MITWGSTFQAIPGNFRDPGSIRYIQEDVVHIPGGSARFPHPLFLPGCDAGREHSLWKEHILPQGSGGGKTPDYCYPSTMGPG